VRGHVASGDDGVLRLEHDVPVGVDQERAEGMVAVLARERGAGDRAAEVCVVLMGCHGGSVVGRRSAAPSILKPCPATATT
jgi:hypothetical protein